MIKQNPYSEILNKCINLYGIQNPIITPIGRGIEGSTFLLNDSVQKYVLKLFPKQNIELVELEIKVIKYLQNLDIPLPKIYAGKNGRYYEKINKQYVILFSFVDGHHLSWGPIKACQARDIGINVASLQKTLERFRFTYYKKQPYADSFEEFRDKDSYINNTILRNKTSIQKELEKLVTNELRIQCIHGDISRENLLTLEGKVVAFLDFGDCHKDYLVWDTAVAITQLFITKSFGIDWMGLRNFLEGYKSIIKLNNSEINAIVPFLMLRNIKIAMQVNYMRMEKKGDKEKLLSIQQSVLKKIRLIGKNREKIYRLITGTLL